MSTTLLLIARLAALFLSALSLSYLATLIIERRRRSQTPAVNAKLKIYTDSGIYRSRFLGATKEGWSFSSPIQKDRHVPLREGETVLVEATMQRGVLRFRSTLTARDVESHVFHLRAPQSAKTEDRRDNARRFGPIEGKIGGRPATFLNLSSCGARVKVAERVAPGDMVTVSCTALEGPTEGVVLEAERFGDETEARIRFTYVAPLVSLR